MRDSFYFFPSLIALPSVTASSPVSHFANPHHTSLQTAPVLVGSVSYMNFSALSLPKFQPQTPVQALKPPGI